MDTEKESELIKTPSSSKGEVTHDETTPDPSNFNETIVQDAIEAIGMGRYQWKLMVSCGFGFIADQVSAVVVS